MPNSRIPTVSMQLVRLMGLHMNGRGFDAETFRRHIGVNEFELARPESRLDLRRYRPARNLLEQTGGLDDFDKRPAAGWVGWVNHIQPELAGLWFNSPSLGAAVRAYARYRPLIGEPDVWACDANDDQVVLRYTPDSGAESCLMSAMSNFLILRELVAHYQHRVDLPVSVRFELGDTGRGVSLTRVADLLQAPVSFNASTRTHRTVLLGRGVWAPATEHHRMIHGWSVQALDERLLALTNTSAWDQLISRIGELIECRWAHADGNEELLSPTALLQDVAQALGMSRWTLRRHLASRGLAFADLVEELRGRRLPTLLCDPRMNLLEVGSRLGFASQSAFSRYYRARHGHPPSRDPAWRGRDNSVLHDVAALAERGKLGV